MTVAPSGVIPAIPTPFTPDGRSVDEAALRSVVRHVVDAGVHGIMTTGGTGEFPHLSREERRRVTEVVVSETAGAVPIFAGTAACSTWEAIALGEDAAAAGADAAILTPPFYFRIPDEQLYGHFADVAASAALPVVVYNNPLYTGNNLSPALIASLMEARRRRRAQAVERRPGAARRGAAARRALRPLALHRHRQPVLRRALRRRPRDLLDRGGDRSRPARPALRPRPGGRPRGGARAAQAAPAAQPLPRVRPRLRLADQGGAADAGLDCGPVRRPLPDFPEAERAALQGGPRRARRARAEVAA